MSFPKPAAAPTLSDVAARANVSKVTASSVLHKSRSNTRVSEATRQRILDIAAELKYRPNAVARSLRRQSTSIIGFYCGHGLATAHNFFLSDVIGGLQEACDEQRRDLLLHGAFHRRSVDDIFDELTNRTVDGLVLIAYADDPLVERLRASSLPVVALADALPGLPSVVVDDAGGTRLLAEHLAARGHRRVYFRASEDALTSVARRHAALRDAAAAHGMTVVGTFPAGWRAPLGAGEMQCLALPRGERPTAAVCWSDTSAYSVLTECRRLGLRVPEDLAVVGFDGIEPPMEPLQRLTSVRAPWTEAARRAVALLVDRIEGRDVPAETVLPVELVEGDTT
ncbi:MAG TPA: LacI family DNA-binding transcriptional regulator [Armatimonadaceae bacterium]|nr:LacI family DNA-binding transcriptional regulator [Armatimonadaceae bacterium]